MVDRYEEINYGGPESFIEISPDGEFVLYQDLIDLIKEKGSITIEDLTDEEV